MKTLPRDIVIVAAKRTPFGTFGGSLKSLTATELGVHAARAALEQVGADPADVDHVIFGNVIQSSPDAIYLARHIGLKAGVPHHVPAMTVNRLCGSGFQSVVSGALEILAGQAEVVLAGGTESMSQAPHCLWNARFGIRYGTAPMGDFLAESLTDRYTGMPMAETAEKLAVQYEISRADADEFAALSQARFAAAQKDGAFDDEIAPVTLPGRRGDVVVSKDEHNRPETTIDTLAKLRPAFRKDGMITAGNASGINDGAGALLVTTREAAEQRGWKPIARLVSWGVAGVDPSVMGIGPAPAIRNALKMADLTLGDIDLIEVNEAFSPQYIAVERELGLDRAKTNVNGGAIAVGHPLAASGSRITANVAYAIRNRGLRFGIGSACIGGGQGIAVVLEALGG
ncbi:MAG: acetyl-CoA C-acetyltransferase [Deltaproteobacteria bacterium]|nr:MAG: acetyl-CoA C-acetyltransferase [Deltaproteobacteria bacterium]